MEKKVDKIIELIDYSGDAFSIRIENYKILLVVKQKDFYIYWILLEGYPSKVWCVSNKKLLNCTLVKEIEGDITEIRVYKRNQTSLKLNFDSFDFRDSVIPALTTIFNGYIKKIEYTYTYTITVNNSLILELTRNAFIPGTSKESFKKDF